MTRNTRRGAALLTGTLALGLVPALVPAQANAGGTSTGAIFNNLSLSTALDSPTASSDQSDDVIVKRGDRLYLGSSSNPKQLSGWRTMSDGSRVAFGPNDYTLQTTGDHAYTMTFKGSTLTINLVQSANVASMYLRTHDGKSLANVEAHKGSEDVGGSMALVNPDGSTVYNGTLSSFKGHGNSTWGYPKKPYQIKLDKSTELVPGAGKAKSWILLANYLDPTLIRNEFAYNLESAVLQRAGVKDDSVKGRMVDLYVDGDYHGAYYLAEKVQVDKNRIDITDTDKANEDTNPDVADLDTLPSVKASASDSRFSRLKEAHYVDLPKTPAGIENDGYLIEMDFVERATTERSSFITSNNTGVTLQTPENASAAEVSFIGNRIQDFEDALYSPTGKNTQGKSWQDYIDVDSFARYYALQEVYMNEDAFKSSTYFHMDKGGKLIATPIWDCDRCDGNLNHGAPATGIHVGSWTRSLPSWIKQLELQPEFRSAVVSAYGAVGPEAATALSTKLPAYASEVAYAAKMDRLRWPDAPKASSSKATPSENVADLTSVLNARLPSLNKIFGAPGYLKNVPLADGEYTISNGKLVADIKGGSTSSGAAAQLSTASSSTAQRFRITRGQGGFYSIIDVKSGKALDVSGGKATAGAKVVQNTPNGDDSQRWMIASTDGVTFSVVSALPVPRNTTNFVLTATGNGTSNGTTLEIQTDADKSGQRFGFNTKAASPSTPSTPAQPAQTTTGTAVAPVAGKSYTIASALNTKMVLDVAGGSAANKTNIDLYTANGSSAQQFTVTAGPNGTVILKTGPGGVVDVAGSGKTPGTNVDEYAANGTTAQQWVLKPTGDGDGSYYIVSKVSGLNMDVANSGTTNGTNVQTYTANGTKAQKFYFYAR